MFDKLFGKKKQSLFETPEQKAKALADAQASAASQAGTAGKSAPPDPASEALFHALEEKRKADPLIGAKVGGREVQARLMNALKTERGIRVEDMLAILGTLAGYACQVAARAQPGGGVMAVDTKDGGRFYFGDAINRPLAESPQSVWAVSAGMAQHLGAAAETFPDIREIFKHASAAVGSAAFGVPRLPEQHMPAHSLFDSVRLWGQFEPLVRRFCPDPVQWPLLYGIAIQETMSFAKGVIAPAMALKIVMECAVPMSKIDMAALPPPAAR